MPMTTHQRSTFKMFADYFGYFDVYDNTDGSMTLEFQDGERVIIPLEVLEESQDSKFSRYILQLFTDKYADRLTINKAVMSAPVNERERIIEINAELDIIRGVVPTPPRYKINVKRTKALMDELNQLIAKEVQ